MNQRKGITPVIAIVLLLLITVGATAVVFTQFQGLAGNGEAQREAEELDRLSSVKLSIIGVTNSSAGNLNMLVKNTGDTPINSSQLQLRVGYDGAQPLSPSMAYSQYSALANSPISYRITQGSTDKTIVPYQGSGDGNSVYTNNMPDKEDSQEFGISLYTDTDTGIDYLIMSNRQSNNAGFEMDVKQLPSGATITLEDDGGSTNEMDLSREPEFDWGWADCCYDGGVVELGSSWDRVVLEPVLGPSPNVNFFESGDQATSIAYEQDLEIIKENNPGCFTSSNNKVLAAGDTFQCETGFSLPEVAKDMTLQVRLDGVGKSWEYNCRRDRASEGSC